MCYLQLSCFDCAGEDLVSKPSNQVEEAEPRPRHQLTHRQPALASLRPLICIRAAWLGRGGRGRRAAVWPIRAASSAIPQRRITIHLWRSLHRVVQAVLQLLLSCAAAATRTQRRLATNAETN